MGRRAGIRLKRGYAGPVGREDGSVSVTFAHPTRRAILVEPFVKFSVVHALTDDWPKLMTRLRHARKLRAESAELERAIAGWHIEGPFLSAEPGFRGAHGLSA